MRIAPVPPALDRAAGWAWRLLVCAVFALAVLVLLWYVRVIVLPSVIAVTIAPALTPVADWLRARGLRRAAPGLALAIGLLAVAALVTVVATSVVAQWEELVEAARDGVRRVIDVLEGEPFNVSVTERDELDASLGDAWSTASDYLVTGLRAGVGFLTGTILAVALLYFLLRDGRALWRWLLRRFGRENQEGLDRAGVRAWRVLGGFVRGTALIAFIDAALIGIGLWLLGVPLAFALAVLIFLGSFVPFVGATISGLVAVLVAYADADWQRALVVLGLVTGVQFLEGNFLQPIIQSRTVDLHPAVILLAVAAGASLFGILGAYLAVPVTAVVFAAVASLHEEGIELGSRA